MPEFEKGDWVKVTAKGRVQRVHDGMMDLEDEAGKFIGYVELEAGLANDVTIEKIEPPVEVFKPGDLVRDKEEGWVFAIGEGGYLRTDDRGGARAFQQSGYTFTSEQYEKVELP